MTNTSEQSFEFFSCSDDSFSEHSSSSSEYDVLESTRTTLSDQTLLMQAFRGAVCSRKEMAREWRTERENDITMAMRTAPDNEVASSSKKSYSSRVRSLMRKLRLGGK